MSREWCLKSPCDGCPFITTAGAVRLTPARTREIADGAMRGESFPCHKTTDFDDDGEFMRTGKEKQCAGALLFAFKQGRVGQMARIMERISPWRIEMLTGADVVFRNTREMLKRALPNRRVTRGASRDE